MLLSVTGVELVLNSSQESCNAGSHYNASFERGSYITGVQYMLKGLPRNLGDTEVMILQRSMPQSLRQMPEEDLGQSGRRKESLHKDRNLVHTIVLSLLMHVHICVTWFIPHLVALMGEVVRFERDHKMAESIFGLCVVTCNALRKMGDGVAGQVLSDALEYTASGVSGAFKEFAEDELRNHSGHGRARAGGR